ncbi:hypothetical protein TMSI_26100 [Klebsiella quasipneumoniae]|nr:hypothetical protein BVZ25_16485 [Klebsiella quasipneumoniae]BBK12218.1 hypothetical protein TMSI_26100 [Klebsiella quasipneumoniae]
MPFRLCPGDSRPRRAAIPGQLVEILPDFPAPRRPLSLLYPHRHLSHKVRVFADWLQGLVATLARTPPA